ncbi:MAG: glycosyltransferase family 4 protein [Acidimicrobiaceae bacterium]|jgi:phosphatidyl-myo-inositol alpha-mannosyltransferase|nr:glycosyltransferase family 4 protein [Acidimicrobiaceae bacterium]MBT5581754.1 glycosyltransferase family 4 protein [Acidimicrobiaceae bacterium]MBT5849230.1 glycosyltransferase family 4 protein [Acidimicrobiaceae bacterium]
MRIGIVCPYSLTVPGGVQMQVLGLARSLRKQGERVRVLAPCDGPPPDAGVTPLGSSLPTAANGSVAPVAPDPAAQLRVIRAMRDEVFDVVHLHEPLAPGPTTTTLLTRPAPMIGTFHAAGSSLAYEMMPNVVRFLANRLDDRCAVSEDARKMAIAGVGGSYDLTFNGVEIARFGSGVPHPTQGPTILFLGRHEPRKGLADLLVALQELPADTRLWVAGEGPETDALKARFAGDARVEWLGTIGETEKISRLRGADVFCAPSLHGESFGIVLLEAMAAGTPVVACDIPGYANVARHGSDAVLVSPGDTKMLAEAIRKVLTEPRRRDALIESGRKRADNFSMARLASLYLERYERLMARSAVRPG